MARTAIPSPGLGLPESSSIATVSIINNSLTIKIPSGIFMMPHIDDHTHLVCPAYSFLVENQATTRRVLFDLSLRKDWENLAPTVVSMMKAMECEIAVNENKNVEDVLESEGVDRSTIEAVFFSHSHFDHTGDISKFPASTKLYVGPGFTEAHFPGFPAKGDGTMLESDFTGRTVQELNFETDPAAINIGGFSAIDYFNDGSFYLLNAPGHDIGHIAALVRTTADTFIFLGGDTVHHGGEFRPTKWLPLPETVSLHPFSTRGRSTCPGELFRAVHPYQSATEPFYTIALGPDGKGVSADLVAAKESVAKLTEFDANENVFTVFAHDDSLIGIVDFFPKPANDWKAKGWATKGKWTFLKDFKVAA